MPATKDKTMAYIRSVRGMSVKVANACEIDRAAVYQWVRVPVERVHTVAKVTGLTPEKIRPDIFKRR